MKRERLLELAGLEMIKEAANVKSLKAADFTKALINNGLNSDNPKFGDIQFVKIGGGPKKDGQYMVVVYEDSDDQWMITWIYAWDDDGEMKADWSGAPEMEGFKTEEFANDALRYIIRRRF